MPPDSGHTPGQTEPDLHARRRDFGERNPAFAVEAGLAALGWLVRGCGYAITSADVWAAYSHTIKAAANVEGGHDIRRRIVALIDRAGARGGFVASIRRPVVERDIFNNIFMPTTVHIPPPLLKSVDRRARALGISRNRLVVRALEQAVSARTAWAPEFLQRLRHVDRETSVAADELLNAVKQARRSKEPRDL